MAARWHRGRRPIELAQSHAPRFLMLQPAAIFDPIASEIYFGLKKKIRCTGRPMHLIFIFCSSLA
ncbi:hypothetical protein [Bradyrhizobium sp. URHD0069]|uniref:hypothetical protein n=1 Tax=Bradyrhizobium sp. URHD0069 TaxID=1380355 RepID=UPI0012DD689E|nr:hypothetical protein [Bradyrhizobium sp. URHD0069]